MARYGINKKPSDFMQELAERHKVLRKQAGYSQSELARRSGVLLGSLKRFESSGQISLESLLLLTDVLNRLNDFESVLKPIENFDAVEKKFSANFLTLANYFKVKNPKQIIEEVKTAVSDWKKFALDAGVKKKTINEIGKVISP